MRSIIKYLEKHLTWFQLLTGGSLATIIGWISHQMAAQTVWVARMGPFGVWLATLGSVGIFLGLIWLAVFIRSNWIDASAHAEWAKNVDDINPLDREFIRRRIKFSSLASPISKPVSGKKFIDCELYGPAVIAFFDGMSISGVSFANCDLVPVKPQGSFIHNTIVFTDCVIQGGIIAHATIYVASNIVPAFAELSDFVSLTGHKEIDERTSPKAHTS